MCGRFYVDDEMADELEKMCRSIDRKLAQAGDIHPSEPALVLHADRSKELCASSYIWGYQNPKSTQLIFDARAESINEKPMFRRDFSERRCIVPVRGFYEWNPGKIKYRFTNHSGGILLLAGIYTNEEQPRFSIITTSADETMKSVHDRMPLVIPEQEIGIWVHDAKSAVEMLRTNHCRLEKQAAGGAEYVQEKLLLQMEI